MTIKQKALLTQDQADQMSEEIARLWDLAITQLEEHKKALIKDLLGLNAMELGISPPMLNSLSKDVKAIKLEMTRGEPAMQEGGKPTISIVYGYPDALHAFLSRTDIPPHLNLANQGGVTLNEDATP